jgi:MFS family permease
VAEPKPRSTREVVAAAAAGAAFEWYDFLVFGSLTPVLSKVFFAGADETTGFLLALGAFAAGFAVRPLGGVLIGSLGDRHGRKRAFLATIVLMGLATFAMGLLPTAAQVGMLAPALLVVLRVLQGFALGGEYGGAATYVAEHASAGRRGEVTSWIQTSAALGLIAALLVILLTRTVLGEAAFEAWGWRVPFLVSSGLLAMSLWLRIRLSESPAFARLQAEDGLSRAPIAEAFGRWGNLRLVLVAFFGLMSAQGAIWYAGFFYAQFFLERTLKVAPATTNLLLLGAAAASAVTYVLFGWLSDRLGRKPVMLFGMILAATCYFPAFHMLTRSANPALDEALRNAPVVVTAAPGDCSVQFDLLNRARFTSACDIAKAVLTQAGASYRTEEGPVGGGAAVSVGGQVVRVASAAGLEAEGYRAARAAAEADVRAALDDAGYPRAADPARMDYGGIVLALFVFVVAATSLYGPLAAALVELFPTRIRFTALSLPYHIGSGWIGGFLPATALAMVVATGDVYFGVWYPVGFAVVSIVTALVFLPETQGRPLD